ncbi:MAG TPA: DNA repair protein RecN [Casimicrobiaceae bacterium]|jgi:DNA repair protein RecN (Recombination protein N)
MLRLLSIRNFAVVEALEVEFRPGFTVLTGETGAGKSILLDALSLLLGDRFETRQLRPGAERAEIAAEFDCDDAPELRAWLAAQDLADEGPLLLRRVLDAQGRSRAYVNGRPATLAQLAEIGEWLIDLHGQHAHQSLGRPDAQRQLLDAFGDAEPLAREVGLAWRAWREATERRDRGSRAVAARKAEGDALAARHAELSALGATADEWQTLSQAQSRLAHSATLLEAAATAASELTDGDAAVGTRLAALAHRLRQAAQHDPALADIVVLVDEAKIRVDEAGRGLRSYGDRLDLDPSELSRVEARLAAFHDLARKHRVRPDALAGLAEDTARRLAELAADSDAGALERAAGQAAQAFDALARQLSGKRKAAAAALGKRVTAMMKELAMAGGRCEITLTPLPEPASFGAENVEFRVATHPKQPLGPLVRVASGGELSRLALAIQVVLAEVARVPTLIFDEVDVGIGGAVAATVGRMLRQLGSRRQVLCVTHLPQVAACADEHYRVTKIGKGEAVASELVRLPAGARVEELARMLGGHEITAKTRAHAGELLAQQRAASARRAR